MRRRLLNLLTVLSLVLCVAVVALWARSYLPNEFFVLSRHGSLSLVFAEGSRSETLGAGQQSTVDPEGALTSMRAAAQVDERFAGVEFIAGPTSPPPRGAHRGEYVVLSVPYGYLFLAAAAPAAWLLVVRRRYLQRAGRNLCRQCGYDIRATPGRCPECGTEPAPALGAGGESQDAGAAVSRSAPQPKVKA
jgi:hypothetical protein